jgi:hypothetical protein
MNNHKATPEQWKADKYDWSKADTEAMDGDSAFRCILELRARVKALEVQAGNLKGSLTSSTPPPVATDEELLEIWNSERACRPWVSRRAIYDLGVAHGQASSREVAEPAPVAGEMVERVSWLIADFASRSKPGDDCKPAAVKIVVEVAKWLRAQGTPASGWAMRLEQEAGR